MDDCITRYYTTYSDTVGNYRLLGAGCKNKMKANIKAHGSDEVIKEISYSEYLELFNRI